MKKCLVRAATAVSLITLGLTLALPAQAQEKAEQPKAEKPKTHQFTGTIESIDAQTSAVTIKHSVKAETKTFTCAADCKFSTADKKEAALADLKVGDKVTVRYVEDGEKLVAKKIAPPPQPAEKKEGAAGEEPQM